MQHLKLYKIFNASAFRTIKMLLQSSFEDVNKEGFDNVKEKKSVPLYNTNNGSNC